MRRNRYLEIEDEYDTIILCDFKRLKLVKKKGISKGKERGYYGQISKNFRCKYHNGKVHGFSFDRIEIYRFCQSGYGYRFPGRKVFYAVPPMMVLPEIKDALEGKDVKIIVDCGIATGADVFKAIALGADAAAVGRSMMPALESEGKDGVIKFIRGVGNELRYIMSSTGFETVSDIDSSVLYEL